MRNFIKSTILCFLMLILSLSVMTNSLNQDDEVSKLEQIDDSNQVLLSSNLLNIPGFQEGSILTDSTLSSGDHHTCAVLDNGSVSCWGNGGDGRLGNGGTSNKLSPTLTSSLGTGRTAVAVSAGGGHTCVILDNGDISCWGGNSNGQLGNGGGGSFMSSPTLTNSLGFGRTAVALSSGSAHTCAILDDGGVSCWGLGTSGQTGLPNVSTGRSSTQPANPLSPTSIGLSAVAISSGYAHTCAILYSGNVSCWGLGTSGQLGDGQSTSHFAANPTSSLGARAVGIATGKTHSCALLEDGEISCWGSGANGKLGNGGTATKTEPVSTNSLGTSRTAISLSAGEEHTCALLDNEAISCWGRVGRLGNGGNSGSSSPTLTSSLGTGRSGVGLSVGESHTCAVLDNGEISCWGMADSSGKLGNGGTSDKNSPTLTSSLGTTTNPRTAALSERDFDNDGILNIFGGYKRFVSSNSILSGGDEHSCVILDNGSVSCWGRGDRLGNGNGTSSVNSTIAIGPLTINLGTGRTAISLSASDSHTCAILDNGSVSCWGNGGSTG
jgi:alpha-tubulin suppressor-like RCC1 family protein